MIISKSERDFLIKNFSTHRLDNRKPSEIRSIDLEFPDNYGSSFSVLAKIEDSLLNCCIRSYPESIQYPDQPGEVKLSINFQPGCLEHYDKDTAIFYKDTVVGYIMNLIKFDQFIDLNKLSFPDYSSHLVISIDITVYSLISGGLMQLLASSLYAVLQGCVIEVPIKIEGKDQPDYVKEKLPFKAEIPLLVSACQLGEGYIMDPTLLEDVCAAGRIVASVGNSIPPYLDIDIEEEVIHEVVTALNIYGQNLKAELDELMDILAGN